MGIFGDIGRGIEAFAGSTFGQAAFGLAGQAIGQAVQARFAPTFGGGRVAVPPMAVSPQLQTGGFVAAGGGPFAGFANRPAEQLRQLAFESLGGGPPMPGVFQLAGFGRTVEAPQPVPFGLDPSCPSFFPNGRVSNPPARFITATNPATGALTWWEHAGQPILFSRDLRVVKRVRRIASKAGVVTRRRTRKR